MTMFVIEDELLRYAQYAFVLLALAAAALSLVLRACYVINDPTVRATSKMAAGAARQLLGATAKRMVSRHHDPEAPRSKTARIIDHALTVMSALVLLAAATLFMAYAVMFLVLGFFSEQGSTSMMALGSVLFIAFLCLAKIVGLKAIDDLRDLARVRLAT